MTLNYYSPNAALPTTFPSISSASLNISVLGKVVFRISFQQIRFHNLRHTAASLMLNHGIPVIVVSNMLGHSKPSIIMDIYGQLYNEIRDQAARIMDELVTPLALTPSPAMLRIAPQRWERGRGSLAPPSTGMG